MFQLAPSTISTLESQFYEVVALIRCDKIPRGQTANQTYYMEIMKRLREAVHRERLELWPNDWILHRDSDPAHSALSVKQFLIQKSITEMEHLPSFPDLAPNDFQLFSKIKYALKGRRFQDIENIHKNLMIALKAISQQEFLKCFQQWQHRWDTCRAAQGSTWNVIPLGKL
jgi:hypothetical protein